METIEQFVHLAEFLSKILDKNSEIVVHDLRNLDSSIIFIANEHVSGRKIGMPATDLLLEKINQHSENEDSLLLNYEGSTNSGKIINSSTYIIKDPTNDIVGALCINQDQSMFDDLDELISKFKIIYHHKNEHTPDIKEQFNIDINGIISQAILDYKTKYNINNFGNKQEKIKLMSFLSDKNIFKLRGSIEFVAGELTMSVPTVYRYLSELSKD